MICEFNSQVVDGDTNFLHIIFVFPQIIVPWFLFKMAWSFLPFDRVIIRSIGFRQPDSTTPEI